MLITEAKKFQAVFSIGLAVGFGSAFVRSYISTGDATAASVKYLPLRQRYGQVLGSDRL